MIYVTALGHAILIMCSWWFLSYHTLCIYKIIFLKKKLKTTLLPNYGVEEESEDGTWDCTLLTALIAGTNIAIIFMVSNPVIILTNQVFFKKQHPFCIFKPIAKTECKLQPLEIINIHAGQYLLIWH